MRGVVLAGGAGSRLYPCTKVTNKHLLPVYHKPMIYYPLELLKSFGMKDVLIVTGGECIGDFMRLLGSGEEIGLNITFKIQEKPLGIAHALLAAEDFSHGEKITVVLGDNIFGSLTIPPHMFTENNRATVVLKKIEDPQRFGVALLAEDKVIMIEEKPKNPKSSYAVTGFYIYPGDVFKYIKTLKPSARGELEITDVNNFYIKEDRLDAVITDGFWSDAGTFKSLLKASNFIAGK